MLVRIKSHIPIKHSTNVLPLVSYEMSARAWCAERLARMVRRSLIASLLSCIRLGAAWPITRFMWSSGVARSHTVKQCESNKLSVRVSGTNPHGDAMTTPE